MQSEAGFRRASRHPLVLPSQSRRSQPLLVSQLLECERAFASAPKCFGETRGDFIRPDAGEVPDAQQDPEVDPRNGLSN